MANAVVETNEHDVQESPVQRVVSGPEKLVQFFRDTRAEMHKVVTPTRTEVQGTTTVVLVTVFIFAAYFAVVDYLVGHGIDALFKWLTKH